MNEQDIPTRRKRLLFVIHSFGLGGAERLVSQMIPILKESYEVGVCCLDFKGQLWEELELPGVTLFCVDRKPGVRIKTFLNLANVIQKFAPDIIHAHQYTPWFYSTVGAILTRSRARIIFTEHGRFYPDVVSAKRRFVNRFLIRKTKFVTAVSSATKEGLVKNEALPEKRVTVLYNGFLPRPFEAANLLSELGLQEGMQILGFVGSLKPVKNPLILVEALKKLLDARQNVALVFVGEGPLREDILNRAEELNVSKQVFLLGIKRPAEPYIRAFDVFALPSWSEGTSLALLEAMDAEIPVVVSDGGGSPEVVEGGLSGVVVRRNDVDELVKGVSQLLAKSPAVISMISQAKQRVREEYSFDRMMKRYLELYEAP